MISIVVVAVVAIFKFCWADDAYSMNYKVEPILNGKEIVRLQFILNEKQNIEQALGILVR